MVGRISDLAINQSLQEYCNPRPVVRCRKGFSYNVFNARGKIHQLRQATRVSWRYSYLISKTKRKNNNRKTHFYTYTQELKLYEFLKHITPAPKECKCPKIIQGIILICVNNKRKIKIRMGLYTISQMCPFQHPSGIKLNVPVKDLEQSIHDNSCYYTKFLGVNWLVL